MNNKISNPFLKQLISEIANKTNQGRLTDISWSVIEERKKNKYIKKEAEGDDKLPPLGGEDEPTKQTPPAPENPPTKDTQVAGLGDVNPAEQDAAGKKAPDADPAAEAPADAEAPPADAEAPADAAPEEDAEKVKADAVKAKAELEKAKAEKDQAEKELEQHTHVKIVSKPGVSFLLSKLLDDAVEKNNLDSLAGEMADKLKIEDSDDFEKFSNEMTPFKALPGVPQLLSSIKTLSSTAPEGKGETEK